MFTLYKLFTNINVGVKENLGYKFIEWSDNTWLNVLQYVSMPIDLGDFKAVEYQPKIVVMQLQHAASMIQKDRANLAIAFRAILSSPKGIKLLFLVFNNPEITQNWIDLMQFFRTRVHDMTAIKFVDFIFFIMQIMYSQNKVLLTVFLELKFIPRFFRMVNFNKNLAVLLSFFNNFLLAAAAKAMSLNSIVNKNWDLNVIRNKPKNSNGLFFNYEFFETDILQNSISQAVLDAMKLFKELKADSILNKYGVMSVQIRTKLLTGKWVSLTPYLTVSKLNWDKWVKLFEFLVAVKALKYDEINKDQIDNELLTISFAFKPITEEDGAIAAAGNLNQIDVMLDKFSHDQEKMKLKIKWFSIWPKLIPMKWNFHQILNTAIIRSSYKTKIYYVENIFIRNPLVTPGDLIANLSNDQLQIFANELKALSAINPNLLLDNPEFIRVTIKVDNITKDVRKCYVFYNELMITEFTDVMINNGMNNQMEFNREFENGELMNIINENLIHVRAKDNPNVFMQKLLSSSWDKIKIGSHFATYDFETRSRNIVDGNGNIKMAASGKPHEQLELISFALYSNYLDPIMRATGVGEYFMFKPISDACPSQDQLVRVMLDKIKSKALDSLRGKKGPNRIFFMYAHNAARFDEIFIIKYLERFLSKNDTTQYLFNNGKFIGIDWIINGKLEDKDVVKTIIRFNDSYLMLSAPLAKLAKTFGVNNKGTFDTKSINQYTDLAPIMNDLAVYNMNDAKILWQILAIHAEQTAKEFSVDIFKAPTISSLAFRVFRTNYLEPKLHEINITDNETYKDLVQGYQGGACDVYNPYSPEGKKVFYYDVNSEYPAMMAQLPMPTGIAIRIKGNVAWQDESFCGFVLAEIIAPESLKVPLLSRVVNGKTIAGVGSWTGLYFAAELREAYKLGYSINAIEATAFTGRVVFAKFINDIYTKRLSFPKSNPMNMLCKLIMNSTYGRFGMEPELSDVRVLHVNGTNDYKSGTLFNEIKVLTDQKVMVISNKSYNVELDTENPARNLQISLPVAAATTSYARINIHRIKMKAAELGVLLYSDTDSVICSEPLPQAMLGKGLGELKLEYTAEKAIFLAPKVYALKNVYEGEKMIGDIIKAKGLQNLEGLTFETFELLLNLNNSHKSFQSKWFRQVENATIIIKDLQNVMRVTSGKRVLVTDLNDNFITTQNVVFQDGKIISPKVIKLGLPAVIPNENIRTIPPVIVTETGFTLVNLDFVLVNTPLTISAPESLLMIQAPNNSDSGPQILDDGFCPFDEIMDLKPKVIEIIQSWEDLDKEVRHRAGLEQHSKFIKEMDTPEIRKLIAKNLAKMKLREAAIAARKGRLANLQIKENLAPMDDYIPDESDFIDINVDLRDNDYIDINDINSEDLSIPDSDKFIPEE